MAPEQSAVARAYSAILDGILNGIRTPGTMLAEAALAAEIGVSRTPVRTALARLQDDGWITIYPKRGALVKGLSERAVADLADARFVMESTSVQRATAADRHALADRLEEALTVQRQARRTQDLRGFIESTILFHRSFVEAGQNSVMLELNDRLADRQRFLLFSYGDTLHARCADTIAEHEGLVRELREGDAVGFAEALRRHLGDTFGTTLRELCPDPGSGMHEPQTPSGVRG